jgi:hypothetical protein
VSRAAALVGSLSLVISALLNGAHLRGAVEIVIAALAVYGALWSVVRIVAWVIEGFSFR